MYDGSGNHIVPFLDQPDVVPFLDLSSGMPVQFSQGGMPGQFGAPEASGEQRWDDVFADQQPHPGDPSVAPIVSLGTDGGAAWDAASHSPQPTNYGDPAEWEQAPFIADMGRDAPGEADEAGEWESSSGTVWGEKVDEYMTRLEAHSNDEETPRGCAAAPLRPLKLSTLRPRRYRSVAPSSPASPLSPLSEATSSPQPSPVSAAPTEEGFAPLSPQGGAEFQLWRPADGLGRDARQGEALGHVDRRLAHPAQLSLGWVDRSKVLLRTEPGGLPAEEGRGRDDMYGEDGGECEDEDDDEEGYDGEVLGNNWEGAGVAEAIGRAPDASAVREGFKMLTSGELGDGAWVLVQGKGTAAIDLSEEIRWWVSCTGRGLRLAGSFDARGAGGAGKARGRRAAISRGRRRGQTRVLLTGGGAAKGEDAVEEGSIVRFRRSAGCRSRSRSLEDDGRGMPRVRDDSLERGGAGGRTRSRETPRVPAGKAAGGKGVASVHERVVSRRAADKRGGKGGDAQKEGDGELVGRTHVWRDRPLR